MDKKTDKKIPFSTENDCLMYMLEKRFEMTFTKIKDIHLYLISLVDRILHVIADMNIRLNYVMELCLGLSKKKDM